MRCSSVGSAFRLRVKLRRTTIALAKVVRRTRIPIIALPIVLIVMAVMSAPAPAASQDPGTAITFYKDVLPVLQKNCQSCHRPGQIGPFSMLTFGTSLRNESASSVATSRHSPEVFGAA